MVLLDILAHLTGFGIFSRNGGDSGAKDGDHRERQADNAGPDPTGMAGHHSDRPSDVAGDNQQPHHQDQTYAAYLGDDHGYYHAPANEDMGLPVGDGTSDLHAVLLSMPDTAAMLDTAISHLDASAAAFDTGPLDVPHTHDTFDPHTGSG